MSSFSKDQTTAYPKRIIMSLKPYQRWSLQGKQTTNGDGIQLKCPSSELIRKLSDFRQTKQFCDITLRVGDVEFYAHKAVLSAFSPYFEAMFSGQFAEATQSTIELTTFECDIMEIILDYLYCNEIELMECNVQAIFQAAHFLQVNALLDACSTYIDSHISVKNCLNTHALATIYRFYHLSCKTKLFIIENFAAVCRENDFLEAEQDFMLDVIQCDSLNVENEDIVFEAVIRWCLHKKERFLTLHKVLSHVRLAYVDPTLLYDWVEKAGIRSSCECSKLIDEAVKYHLLPSRRAEVPFSIRKRRKTSPEVEVLVLEKKDKGLECLNEENEVIKVLSNPPNDCRNLVVSSYNGTVFSCRWETIYSYNFSTNNWVKVAENLKPRHFFALCELDGFWYAIGGTYVGGSVCDVVERYQSSTNSWKQVTSMPTPVAHATAVCLNGMVYVFGGVMRDHSASKKVQRYDPRLKTWTVLADMPVPLRFPSACVLNGLIYIFHFIRDSGEVEGNGRCVYAYNIATNQWTARKRLQHRFISGPVVMNERIFVLTKLINKSPKFVIMCYSPGTDAWHEAISLGDQHPRLFSGLVLTKA